METSKDYWSKIYNKKLSGEETLQISNALNDFFSILKKWNEVDANEEKSNLNNI